MSADSISKYVAKPAMSFAVGSAIGAYMRPGMDVSLFGKDVPAWVIAGLAVGIGSEVVALVHDYVMPHVPALSAFEYPAETALAIGVNAGAGALTYNVLVPGALGQVGTTELVAAAALAEVISGYVTEKWAKPMLQQQYSDSA